MTEDRQSTKEIEDYILTRPYTTASSLRGKFAISGKRAANILKAMQKDGILEVNTESRKYLYHNPSYGH